MAGENTLNFTDSAFDQDVLNSDVPVLVDVDTGHTIPRLTIPNGVMATLDSSRDLFRIDEPAVR